MAAFLPEGLFAAEEDGVCHCTWCQATPVYRA